MLLTNTSEKRRNFNNPEIGPAQKFLPVKCFAVRQVLKDTGISCGAEFVFPNNECYSPCSAFGPGSQNPLHTEVFCSLETGYFPPGFLILSL